MQTYLFFQGGFTVLATSVALLIAALVWSPPPQMSLFLETPALRWVGAVSYGAYLWNLPIAMALEKMHWPAPIAHNAIWLSWGGSLLAGALSHYYVEAPFLRLKHRWERSRSVPTAAVPLPAAA